MGKMVLCFCLMLPVAIINAQETGTYSIISLTGKIIDQKSGKELTVGNEINLQTDLQFGSLYDKAVLLSPTKVKYFLELPKSSFITEQMVVASSQALIQVKSRPQLVTRGKGSVGLSTKGVTVQTLKEYFGTDTFTIIGSSLTMPVPLQDARKYDLILCYENGKEDISPDFIITQKADARQQGNTVKLLLKNGNDTVKITRISLFFIDETRLIGEFDALLQALGKKKENISPVHSILREYCADVYGTIDEGVLEKTIRRYLKSI